MHVILEILVLRYLQGVWVDMYIRHGSSSRESKLNLENCDSSVVAGATAGSTAWERWVEGGDDLGEKQC